MKKLIESNIWIITLGICLFTVLGIWTLETNSFIEIDLIKLTFKIDARKDVNIEFVQPRASNSGVLIRSSFFSLDRIR